MHPVFQKELQTALNSVIEASRICRAVQAKLTAESLEKKDKSPVTIADYASQAVICRQILQAFPGDPIVGEEDAGDLRDASNREFLVQTLSEVTSIGVPATESELLQWIDSGSHDGTAARYWTLDPIDGTKGFLRKEQFAIALALLIDQQIQVAALACPNLPCGDRQGALFYAIRGNGAFMVPLDDPQATPVRIHVSSVSDSTQIRMCESVESGHSSHNESAVFSERLGIVAEPVRMDSQAKYAAVARGDAELYLRLPTRKGYEEKIWDHAAGVLVLEEAGGRVTDIEGKPLDFRLGRTLKNNRGVVVTNAHVHDAVIQALTSNS